MWSSDPLIVVYGGISSGTRLPPILIYVCEYDSHKLMVKIIVRMLK
ncbi:MAG: hypothetical protein ABJB73_01185 [Candidatus Nitrosocosmicus sp.]